MLYGYLPAVITGFLLTAIPNWTGHLPLQGGPLAALATAWITGRIAVWFSTIIGPLVAAVIDALFLVLVVQRPRSASRPQLAWRGRMPLPTLAVGADAGIWD